MNVECLGRFSITSNISTSRLFHFALAAKTFDCLVVGVPAPSSLFEATGGKECFLYMNFFSEEVATSSTDTKTTGQTLELGDEQTRDHLTKTTYQDNVQKQTGGIDLTRGETKFILTHVKFRMKLLQVVVYLFAHAAKK